MPPTTLTRNLQAERTVAAQANTQFDQRGSDVARKRMLVVVNPYASTVSSRLKNLVLYALRSSYRVEAVETESQNHATSLCREAVDDGFDLVVAFGGDGTVNEAANGLVGTDVPLAVLPGGLTNVFGRTLGIPNDIVAATEHLLRLNGNYRPHKVDLGCVNGRFFTFGSGIGIDSDAVRRVDSHPRLKSKTGEAFYIYELLLSFNRFRGRQPIFQIEIDDREPIDAVFAVIQNAFPYTFLGKRYLDVCQDVALNSGTLSCTALSSARYRDLPTLTARLLTNIPVNEHRHVEHAEKIQGLTVQSIGGDDGEEPSPFPLHVDGDYIGNFTEAAYSVHPNALTVLA